LTSLSVNVSGPAAADFSVTALTQTTLAAGETTPFTVTFDPSSSGDRNAIIQVTSNDSDESPFAIAVTGNGGLPEIVVRELGGAELTSGESLVDWGIGGVGESNLRTFEIENTGGGPLTGLAPTTLGLHDADFTPGELGPTTLNPGEKMTFTVDFSPSALGSRFASLKIASNDADENPFVAILTGTGGRSDINIKIGQTTLASGDSYNLGDAIGVPGIDREVTIENIGDFALHSLAITIDGPNAADFSFEDLGSTSIAPGESTTFTASFATSGFGDRSADFHIASNDTDENPFDITFTAARIASISLDNFADVHGLNGNARAQTADDDGDSVPLIVEYAFDMNPTIADAQEMAPGGLSGLPIIRLINGKLTIEFIRRRGDPTLNYIVEFGDSPIEGTANGLQQVVVPASNVTNIDAQFQRVIIQDTVDINTNPRRFGRVRIE
ncbi:MAG: choice-of-anchor D domain-containing protein, partial [Planctomycetota bacterium]